MRASMPTIRNAAVLLLIGASIAAFARGWVYSDMAAKIAWEPAGLRRLALLSIGFWAFYFALQAVGRRKLPVYFGAAALVALIAFAGAIPVVSTMLMIVAALAIGDWLWDWTSAEPGTRMARAYDLPLKIALGLAALVTVVQALGPLPIHGSLFYLLLLVVPVALRARALYATLAPRVWGHGRDLPRSDVLLFGVLANLVLVVGVGALLPEVGHDALALHLAFAAYVRDFGRWHYDVLQNVYAVIPLGGDYLYAIGYVLGGETAARMVNLATLLVTLWLVYGAVRAHGTARIALVATMIAASSPIALLATTSLFVENPLAMLAVAAMLCALACLDEPKLRRWVLVALLFGAAVATKLIALALLPALAVSLWLALARRPHPLNARHVLLLGALTIAFAAAPYVIALAKTGNPVFPLFNAWFRSPLYPAENFYTSHFLGTFDPLALYRMTFYSDQYIEGRPGAFGFAFVLLAAPVLVAALVWGSTQVRLIAFTALSYFVIAVAGSAYLRYIYPVVFLFAILTGWVAAGARLARGVGAAIVATAGAGVLFSVAFLPAATAQMRSLDLVAIANERERERYITTWAPMRDLVRFLNAYKSDSSAALVLGAPHTAELERRSYTDSSYMRRFRERLARVETSDQLRDLFHAQDIGFALLDSSARDSVRAHLRSLARPIYRSGAATLYRVDARVRFPNELVLHPVLAEGFAGWVRHGEVRWDAGSGAALVDVSNLLYQPVALGPARRYRLAVEAKCALRPTQLRLQVNWLDARGRDLGPYLLVAPCASDWFEEETWVTAPPAATTGVVYASGHAAESVRVRRVSLRAR